MSDYNPLQGEGAFQLSLANPNPTSGKNKQGAWYKVSFELTQEEWQWFQDAETAGMVLELQGYVTHSNPKRDPDTVDAFTGETDRKGGPLSQRSDALARDKDFRLYLHASSGLSLETTPDAAREYIRHWCGVESRAELDHNEAAAEKFLMLLKEYLAWTNN